MKIAFIGSHGTGKTTLAKEVAKRLSTRYISETALHVKSLGYKLFPNTDERTQLMIFLHQLNNEMKFTSGVFDRCLLDNVAYSIEANLFNNDIINEMLKITLDMLNRFDYIFLVTRFSDKIEKNEYRDDDLQKHMKIESIIVDLLHRYFIKHYLIYEKTLDERVDKILNTIQ